MLTIILALLFIALKIIAFVICLIVVALIFDAHTDRKWKKTKKKYGIKSKWQKYWDEN